MITEITTRVSPCYTLLTPKTIAKALVILACAAGITITLHFLNKKLVWIDMSSMK